jgi:hypothetical protein
MKPKIKININSEQIKKIFNKYKDLMYVLVVLTFVIGMAIGAYLAINPAEDAATAQTGETAVQSLNITFNNKVITNLETETAPSTVSGPAGRNPFMPY